MKPIHINPDSIPVNNGFFLTLRKLQLLKTYGGDPLYIKDQDGKMRRAYIKNGRIWLH